MRKREDEKEYRKMLPRKERGESWHERRADTLTTPLRVFQGSFYSSPPWGCPHCSWCWFSSSWASRTHFPLCSLRKNSTRILIYTVDLHQKWPSISVGTAVSVCKSKRTKTEASNRNVDVLGLWDHIFLYGRKFSGKGSSTRHKKCSSLIWPEY